MKIKWPPRPILVAIPLVEIKLMVRNQEEVIRHIDELLSDSDGGISRKAETLENIHSRLSYIISRFEMELRLEDPPVHLGMKDALHQFQADSKIAEVSKAGDMKTTVSDHSYRDEGASCNIRRAPELLNPSSLHSLVTHSTSANESEPSGGFVEGGKGDADGKGRVERLDNTTAKAEFFVEPLLTDDPNVKALCLERLGIAPTHECVSSKGSLAASFKCNPPQPQPTNASVAESSSNRPMPSKEQPLEDASVAESSSNRPMQQQQQKHPLEDQSQPTNSSVAKSSSNRPVPRQEEPLEDLSKLRVSLYLSRRFCPPSATRIVIKEKLAEIGITDVTCFNAYAIIFRVSYARARELLQTSAIIEVGGVPLLVEPAYTYSYLRVLVTTDKTPSDFHRMVPASAGLLEIHPKTNPVRLKLTFVDRAYAKKFLENPPLSVQSHNLFFSMEVDQTLQEKAGLGLKVRPVKYSAIRLKGENPAMRLSDPRALMEAFGGQGWNVFFVSPEKNPQSGTVFFNDLPAAKEFLVTPVSAGGFLLKPYAFANPINDWYRVKK